ncbi:MAG TPA: hypothetical protein PLL23_01180 [Chitinophagaceae bacterium]|nr:hypothetical protein [Chitinophagaceae bacterium]
MKLDYQYLLVGNFDPQSRVWIYQCNRLFSLSEAFEVEDILKQFTGSWLSHGTPVKGAAYLFFGQFIVLMADETASGVSGCSTDTSVRLIKDIEQRFGVTLFDRLSLAFVVKDKVELLPLSQLPYAAENGFINGDTLYFNNLVQTKKELETNWIIPVKESWLAKKIEFSGPVS